jgi:hypothetical protein
MSEAMPLSKTEQIMFKGIQAREREAERNVLAPLREDLQEVLQMITERLGIPSGSIGTTHALDIENWVVMPNPTPPQGPSDDGDRGDDDQQGPIRPNGSGDEIRTELREMSRTPDQNGERRSNRSKAEQFGR